MTPAHTGLFRLCQKSSSPIGAHAGLFGQTSLPKNIARLIRQWLKDVKGKLRALEGGCIKICRNSRERRD